MTQPSREELLPCPFCGKPPETQGSGEGQRGLMIDCITPNCVNPHVSYYDHVTAIRIWNGRRPAIPHGEGLERAADAIDAARYAHLGHPRERPRPFSEADKSDREYAFRLARAALSQPAETVGREDVKDFEIERFAPLLVIAWNTYVRSFGEAPHGALKQMRALLRLMPVESLKVALPVVQPDREGIARIIEPDAFTDLEKEREWCAAHNKPLANWAEGHIRRCDAALAKADAIRALFYPTGGTK